MFAKNNKSHGYNPGDTAPFKLSRTQLQLYLDCPCCFYLQNRLQIKKPPQLPFTLNSAVDTLLKKEFDTFRNSNDPHPLIKKYGLDAKPVAHPKLKDWRNNFAGIQYHHPKTNFLLYGAIDDLWQNSKGEYIVVDYKSTAVSEPITALNKPWHKRYKMQMEFYQWLLEKNGYKVADTGYFVYCNGKTGAESFSAKLEFDMVIIPHKSNLDWIETTIDKLYQCLNSDTIPAPAADCETCNHFLKVEAALKNNNEKQSKLENADIHPRQQALMG